VIKFWQNWYNQKVKYYCHLQTHWNKEELPDQWKESIIAPTHKKGDKTDCNN
jgi:hypothetical protein